METLTINELQAIAISIRGIRYPRNSKGFIFEVYNGIFFQKLGDIYQVDDKIVKQKLEKMLIQYPQQFQFLYEKMNVFWDEREETSLVARLAELKLI